MNSSTSIHSYPISTSLSQLPKSIAIDSKDFILIDEFLNQGEVGLDENNNETSGIRSSLDIPIIQSRQRSLSTENWEEKPSSFNLSPSTSSPLPSFPFNSAPDSFRTAFGNAAQKDQDHLTLHASLHLGSGGSEASGSKPPVDLPRRSKKVKKEIFISKAQLISSLPLAEEEAARSYTVLETCTYASKALGNFSFFDQDSISCDFTYRVDIDNLEQSCGVDAQCMNRLMQIECIEGDCKCGEHCQNQRFNKKEYAPIEVVKTEQKGFGVRITCDLPADTFVYEYVGEVIGPTVFKKKMKDYSAEGIRHFYFMALDKDIYIDATKRGGKGRFLNHSCNPNCVVAKWTVGSKMRMGIFTKRDVKKDEELTFNYNVDRYGHEAQVCHCGEAQCVGFIGGKTQTDIGGMDDLYLDALGIADEVEALGLRGTKKKKGKQMDDDFIPLLRAIEYDEVPKVSAAVRQAITNRRILEKLLIRMKMTTDEEILRQLLRLHGYTLMNHILRENSKDVSIVTLTMEILIKWPLKTRNKVESSKIEDSVELCLGLEDASITRLAQQLLDEWRALELGYRIPRAIKDEGLENDRKRAADFTIDQIAKRVRIEAEKSNELSRPTFIRPEASLTPRPNATPQHVVPVGWHVHTDLNSGKSYYENLKSKEVHWKIPPGDDNHRDLGGKGNGTASQPFDVNAIIAQATADAEKVATEVVEKEVEQRSLKLADRAMSGKHKVKAKATTSSKEKKVMAQFSTIVISVMSKHKAQFEPEQFKKRAREVTQLLCEKEAKHPSYGTDAYEALSADKIDKVRLFTKNWVKKLLERKKDKNSSTASTSASPACSSVLSSSALTLSYIPPGTPPPPFPPSPCDTNTPSSVPLSLEAVTEVETLSSLT